MTTLFLFAIAALVLVNGFFVACEFALVSVRRGQVRGGSLAARLARRQQDKLDEYLSACQLGITIASLALGAIGETPASSHAQQASLEELRQLIGGLSEEGHLDEADAQLLQGVFTLDERRAGEVMTPRTRVTSMREGQTAREALVATRDAGHSRFPLLDRSGEQLLGVVYGRELTEALLDEEGERPVESFRHESLVVPPTLPLDVLLARMQEQRTSICAVLDEYCMFNGVVTVEDILEEIVGEIWDEDDPPSGIRQLADGRIVCRGDTSLLDLEPYGVHLEGTRASGSIGGVIQDSLGRLARPGDRLRFGAVRAGVLSTTASGRIKRVLLAIGAVAATGALYWQTTLRPAH